MKNIYRIVFSLFFLNMSMISFAQEFDASIQFRPRYEYRNGYKELIPDNELPTSFISQRSRLNLNFKHEKLSANIKLQNVRVWGDVKTTTTSDKNGVMLFEAWGQYDFNSNWSARFGRQVISYDNQRILGEIDWAQQGQSHDALVVSYKKNKMKLDIGTALNADAENLYRDLYTTNYKNLQYAWFHTVVKDFQVSLLALNTGFQYEDAVTNELETDYLQTFGTFLKYKKSKFNTDLSFYTQTGKSSSNTVFAYNVDLNMKYNFTAKFSTSLGYEILSGKAQNDSSNKVKSFAPLFGTNHGFNGYMDYFYVGNHKNSVGLQDLYLKLNYAAKNWKFSLIPHVFMTAADVIEPLNVTQTMDSYLGTEIDFTTSYQLHKNVGLTAGYSQMFATKTMEVLKSGNRNNNNNWAWVMLSFNPQILSFSK